MTIVTCTHRCEACGTEHYSEKDHDFHTRCRGCDLLTKLIRDESLETEVRVVEG